MRAAVTTEVPQEIVLQEKVIPDLESDEVLIKVAFCGVCGSDLHAYKHAKGYEFVQHPRILGHEVSGVIVRVGSERFSERIGNKVIIESMNYCGTCDSCQQNRYSICLNNQVIGLHFDGGMAEYVKTKAKFVKDIFAIPQEIAVLSEPMAVAVHAFNRLDKPITNKDVVLVQGAGIIGFFTALLCVESGAKVYISGLKKDYDSRLKKFASFNMIPHIVENGLIVEKADVIFECSGSNQAVISTFKQLKKGGSAVVVALYEQEMKLFLTDIVRNEWAIIPSYGCDPDDYEESMQMLKKYAEPLKEIVSYYPFDRVKKAFDDGSTQKVLKPIISMNEK